MSSLKEQRVAGALLKARRALRGGDREDAIRRARQVLTWDPDNANARQLLSEAEPPTARGEASAVSTEYAATFRHADDRAREAEWSAAEVLYRQLDAAGMVDARLSHNWAVSLRELGRLDEAVARFEQAIALQPSYANAYLGLAQTYRALGVPSAALLAVRLARDADPDHLISRLEHIDLLVETGALAEAVDAAAQFDPSSPGFARAQNLRGLALRRQGDLPAAQAAFTTAIEADPQFSAPLQNRANTYLRTRNFARAVQDFDAAMRVNPGAPWIAGLRLHAAMRLFDWRNYEAQRDAIVAAAARGEPAAEPLVVQYLTDSPEIQQTAARTWARLSVRAPSSKRGPLGFPAGRKIRIAYISRDFHSHPVSFLIAEVLELHDREMFDVVAIHLGAVKHDSMQDRLRAAADAFIDARDLSDEQVVEVCRQLHIDIAVDLAGYTESASSAIFASRIAPVQLLYIGYLGTSGATNHDYLIADRHLIDASTRACYDEQLLLLPSYQANDRTRPHPIPSEDRTSLGLPLEGFVFCCFNNPGKVTPETFAAWVRIMNRVPDAVLWLLAEEPEAREHLRAHAARIGLSPDRLVFADRCGREAYLARLAMADLFLDTWPYNAGTTASDALWMGLPVLTLRGRSFAGRMASSLLHAIGMPALITESEDAYVDLAVTLAGDADRMKALREELAQRRETARLFDAPAFTRSLELGMMAALSGTVEGDVVVEE